MTMATCGFDPDELLPPGAGSGDGASPGLVRHVTGCPECSRSLADREEVARELRRLPRLQAPAGAQSALRFEAVMERVDEARLDARLAAEEPAIRRLLRLLVRLRAPSALVPPVPDRRRSAVALRPARIVALAAAAALVAAVAIPSILAPAPGRSLAKQTAILSERTPIPVRVVRIDPRSADAAELRARIPMLPTPHGGGS